MAKIPVSYGTSDDNKVQITYDDGEVQILFPYDCPGGGGTEPEGTLYITGNGVYDVTTYAEVDVNVQGSDTDFSNFIAAGRDNTGQYIFPTGTFAIGPKMFEGYTAMAEITLPDTLTTLSDECFANCPGLIMGNFPSNVAEVGARILDGNTATNVIRFTSHASTIDENAFTGMTGLTDIYVPWSEGEVAGAPWTTKPDVTVHYNELG